MTHQFRVLLWRVFRRGSFRDVLPLLVLALAARAVPARNVQAVEPQAEQRRPVSYRNDIVPLLSKAGCNLEPADTDEVRDSLNRPLPIAAGQPITAIFS